MNTFSRKLKLSFRAMAWGWVACTLTLLGWLLLHPKFHELELGDRLAAVGIMTVSPGFVILIAWLVIFLPVDLLVPDQSRLRRPGAAAFCGFIAGSSVVGIQWITAIVENDTTRIVIEGCLSKGLPVLLSPGITGMVAAYVRSRKTPARINEPTPLRP